MRIRCRSTHRFLRGRALPESCLHRALPRYPSTRLLNGRDPTFGSAAGPIGSADERRRGAGLPRLRVAPRRHAGGVRVRWAGRARDVAPISPVDAENRSGRPFVGPAGRCSTRVWERVGNVRSAAYVTNAVKHVLPWPPDPVRTPRRRAAGCGAGDDPPVGGAPNTDRRGPPAAFNSMVRDLSAVASVLR